MRQCGQYQRETLRTGQSSWDKCLSVGQSMCSSEVPEICVLYLLAGIGMTRLTTIAEVLVMFSLPLEGCCLSTTRGVTRAKLFILSCTCSYVSAHLGDNVLDSTAWTMMETGTYKH